MFEELLTGMVQKIPGTLGATLIGYDGIPVACMTPKGPRTGLELGDELWEAASIDLLRSLEGMREISRKLNSSAPEQVSIQTEDFTLLMRPLSEQYVLVLALNKDTWAGKGRYIMRVVGAEISQELP